VDPLHFCTDPVPRIRTTYLQFRIQILLFSSVTFKMPKKIHIFCLLLFEGTFTSFFKDKKSDEKKSQKVEIKVFLTGTFLLDGRSTDTDRIQVWKFQKHTDPQHYL
jgi:hypothetical protein